MMRWRQAMSALALALLAVSSLAAAEPPKTAEEIRALTDEDRNEEAAVAARRLLERVDSRYGPKSVEVAEALELLARALARAHFFDPRGKEERLAWAERALEIRLGLDDQPPVSLAWSHYVVGLVHNLVEDYPPAVESFNRALRIVEAHLGEKHPETEVYLREYGSALLGDGRYRKAIDVTERYREVAVARHGAGHPDTLPAYYNLALAWHDLGDLEQADRHLLNAENVLAPQESKNAIDLVWVRSLRGTILSRQGRLAEAQRHFTRTLKIARERLGPDSREVVQLKNVLARTMIDIGDFDRASDLLSQALQRYEGRSLDTLAFSILYNLGLARHAVGDGAGARAALERYEKNAPALLDVGHPLWGDFHNAYAAVLSESGDNAAARKHVDRALILHRKMGEDTLEYAGTLTHSGRLSIAEGNPQSAVEQLGQALEIIERIAKGHPGYYVARQDMAEALYASGRRAEAFDMAVDGARKATEFDRATIALLARRQAIARAVRPRYARDIAFSLVVSSRKVPASWKKATLEILLESRSMVFDEMAWRSKRWKHTGDPRLRARLEEWNEARTRVANLVMIGPINCDEADYPCSQQKEDVFYTGRLEAEQQRVERLEDELAQWAGPHRDLLRRGDVDLDALKAALRRGEALVSYTRFGKSTGQGRGRAAHYAAAVLRHGDDAPEWFDLGPASNLERAIAGWRSALAPSNVKAVGEQGYREAAGELQRLAWAPLTELLSNTETVYVVPDATMHLVSFAALPDGGSTYLLESGPAFHYLTAERDLVPRELPAEIQVAGLLVVGDPAFNAGGKTTPSQGTYRGGGPVCASFRTHRFTRLPGSKREVRAVRSLWAEGIDEPVVELTGKAATEEAVKRQVTGRRVLHLATHGFFLGDECAETGDAYRGISSMSPARRPEDSAVPRVGNPLLLSGLALAGANRRTKERRSNREDGVLTAEEVGTLDLQGTELAVLSACRTGTGSVTEGEGMFGLRRAFLLAGARTVVTSLWDVEDRSASLWIEELYRKRLLDGTSMPEAMRSAGLHVLEMRRKAKLGTHPFYWAGWVAFGDR